MFAEGKWTSVSLSDIHYLKLFQSCLKSNAKSRCPFVSHVFIIPCVRSRTGFENMHMHHIKRYLWYSSRLWMLFTLSPINSQSCQKLKIVQAITGLALKKTYVLLIKYCIPNIHLKILKFDTLNSTTYISFYSRPVEHRIFKIIDSRLFLEQDLGWSASRNDIWKQIITNYWHLNVSDIILLNVAFSIASTTPLNYGFNWIELF